MSACPTAVDNDRKEEINLAFNDSQYWREKDSIEYPNVLVSTGSFGL